MTQLTSDDETKEWNLNTAKYRLQLDSTKERSLLKPFEIY